MSPISNKKTNSEHPMAATQMEFTQDIRRDLSDAEKLAAAARFRDLVQGVLFRFADKARVHDHTLLADRVEAKVSLIIPQGDGSNIDIYVSSATRDSGECDSIIETYERYDGRAHGYHRYYIEEDTVLRHDVEDLSRLQGMDGTERPHQDDDHAMLQYVEGRIADHKNALENQSLEKDMGINDQPVGLTETDKLGQLLEIAEPHDEG